jgi:hypothetical protein
MGTQRVQMKRVLSWLIRWALHAGTRGFFPALAALVGPPPPPNTKYFFPFRTLFQFISPHRPASWAGGRAGSPVFLQYN